MKTLHKLEFVIGSDHLAVEPEIIDDTTAIKVSINEQPSDQYGGEVAILTIDEFRQFIAECTQLFIEARQAQG